jgi:hypothetical protein
MFSFYCCKQHFLYLKHGLSDFSLTRSSAATSSPYPNRVVQDVDLSSSGLMSGAALRTTFIQLSAPAGVGVAMFLDHASLG